METFSRLAGVSSDTETQTPESRARPAQLVIPEPPPIPQDDNTDGSHRGGGNRASIPLNRQPSQHSLRSIRRNGAAAATGGNQTARRPSGADSGPRPNDPDAPHQQQDNPEDEFTWGPNHPCFPHPNPHVPRDSEAARTTRVIRVRRDWLSTGDLCPQYANLYPEVLDPHVRDDEFRVLISGLNTRLQNAFDPFRARAWVDAMLSVVTGFLWEDWGLTGAKSGMKSVERFLDAWNLQKERDGVDVRVVQLRTTGFMSLDFVVPDPGFDNL